MNTRNNKASDSPVVAGGRRDGYNEAMRQLVLDGMITCSLNNSGEEVFSLTGTGQTMAQAMVGCVDVPGKSGRQ